MERPPGLTGATRPNGAVTRDWVRALDGSQRLTGVPGNTLASVVAAMAVTRGAEPALIGEGCQLSYAGLSGRANQYARWALGEGIAAGEVVALLMTNQPDYIAIWLGLTQVGCVVALLNTHIAADALAHCIRSAGALHVIAGTGVPMSGGARWWSHGRDVDGLRRVDTVAACLDAGPVEPRAEPCGRALLIYTSGTTGLPKAANVSHARVLEWSGWFAGMMDAKPQDRLYDCLPLYHSTGGVVAVGAMLAAGGSVVLRERFSASRFWADVAQTGSTVFQYIGELCRYLLNAAPGPADTAHRLRLCCGNGLSGAVWPEFQQRFAIPRILEFYAATEGSVSLYNCEGRPGAIGRVPGFLAHRFPVMLVRCDPETGEPLRGPDGRCTASGVDEPGEAVALLAAGSARRFEGYTDPDASARKILTGVFAEGDRWFRTGDLMRKDAAGFYYFVDRLGDTYRWKGENVASTEVAAVLLACPGVTDAVAYGVAVPGAEGKAGMAALVTGGRFSLPALHEHLAARLPGYARPIFVRLCGSLDRTGTFKLNKSRLARDGYAGGGDPVWFHDRAAFIPLTAVAERIEKGTIQL